MKRVQGLTGRKLPAVVYPVMEGEVITYDNWNAPFADRTIQPKVPDWQRMRLEERASLAEIKAVFARQGFTGITFDVFHCHGFENPPDLAARLAAGGLVRGVHLAVNRLDMLGMAGWRSSLGRRTRAAKRAFAHSAYQASKTPEGELLQIIAREWRKNPAYKGVMTRVVLEDGPVRRYGRTTRDHAAILAHARELVAGA